MMAGTMYPAADADAPEGLGWLRALLEPRQVQRWSVPAWERVVRLARRHRLLARLAWAVHDAGLESQLPLEVSNHLAGARAVSQARTRAMTWLVERLPAMLDHPAYPLVLLKGAAYVAQGLPIAKGRLPSDLDILVPPSALEHAQFFLRAAGWQEPALDDHDRRYYFEWSHELPPLRHRAFDVELDVHHHMLAPRRGSMPDTDLLLAQSRPVGKAPWRVLSPVDQLLHCAAHLFHDSAPRDRLRDVVDLDGLFREVARTPSVWPQLDERAVQFDLIEPLYLATHFCRRLLDTPVDADLVERVVSRQERSASTPVVRALMQRALTPAEPGLADGPAKGIAEFVLLARYHWHRLPPRLLLRHAWHKWRRGTATASPADTNAP